MKNNTSGNFSEKMMEWVNRFANSKAILSLKDGFVLTMPITLIGSIFMLIGTFPIPGWETFMAGIFGPGWQEPLNQVTGATFDIIALIAVFGIAYYWAKHSNVDAVPAGLLALVSFLIITDSFVALPEEVMNAISNEGVALQTISGVIPKSWTGGQGMVTAILVGFLVGAIYSWFVRHKITIKMPESVPEGVSNAFSALIPGVVIVTLFLLLYIIFDMLAGKTLTAIIYQILQLPMQHLSDSLGGIIAIMALISLFWLFGLHGPNIVMGVMSPILTANVLANQKIVDAGGELIARGANANAAIVGPQMVDIYCKFGGAGLTLGLLIAVFIAGRSRQLRTLSKMSLVPGIFNINEPVIFGLPIVMNPILAIPFIVTPVIAAILTYFSIKIGFIAPFISTQIPWTTPPLISGFLLSGWQGALLQLIILVISIIIYLPFVKMQDRQFYEMEKVNVEE